MRVTGVLLASFHGGLDTTEAGGLNDDTNRVARAIGRDDVFIQIEVETLEQLAEALDAGRRMRTLRSILQYPQIQALVNEGSLTIE